MHFRLQASTAWAVALVFSTWHSAVSLIVVCFWDLKKRLDPEMGLTSCMASDLTSGLVTLISLGHNSCLGYSIYHVSVTSINGSESTLIKNKCKSLQRLPLHVVCRTLFSLLLIYQSIKLTNVYGAFHTKPQNTKWNNNTINKTCFK